MLKGIDINQRVKFSSKFDTSKPKTVFTLKPLSGVDMLETQSDKPLIGLFIKSIEKIENFDGETDVEKIIYSLQSNVFNEILEEINKINDVSEIDKKN